MRIIYIQGLWWNGGIEKVVHTYCHKLVDAGNQVDVFAFEKRESVFDKDLEELGVKVFSPKEKIEGGYIKHNIIRLKEFLALPYEKYDIVHYNTSFAMAYIHCWFLKRKNKRIKVILHSHGNDVNSPFIFLKRSFNNIIKRFFQNVPDYCIACSEEAGKWLFSQKNYYGKHYCTLMNAMDFDIYRFNSKKREIYRANWKIDADVLLIGTIGRFSYQKNPDFIVEIIQKLSFKELKFKFLWVREGEERERIICEVEKRGLEDRIVFLDATDDVPGCLSALDMMILPSRYEGLGLVLLEAQAAGLITLAAATVPKEAKITNRFFYLSIESEDEWVEKILDVRDACFDREFPNEEIEKSGFNVRKVMKKLSEIYER